MTDISTSMDLLGAYRSWHVHARPVANSSGTGGFSTMVGASTKRLCRPPGRST